MSKIEQGDFSFQISSVESSPLTRKLQAAGLQLLLEKGVLTDQAKEFAEIQLQKMADVREARKASGRRRKILESSLLLRLLWQEKEMIWCIQALNQATVRLAFSLFIST